MCFGPQANRRVFRVAVNTLICEDPAKHPDLAQVLQAMGWDPSKTVLHCVHPAVIGTEESLPLCPPATTIKSVLHDRSKQVNVEFSISRQSGTVGWLWNFWPGGEFRYILNPCDPATGPTLNTGPPGTLRAHYAAGPGT